VTTPTLAQAILFLQDQLHCRSTVELFSHQVIILSTDTEVDESFYSSLTPSIARAYHLRYDDDHKATVGEEGYFWNEQILNAQ
jgi:DNA sulfur modification protein DndD